MDSRQPSAVSRQPFTTFVNSAARWRGCRVPDSYMGYRASSMGASLGVESGGRVHHTRAAQCGWPRLSRFSMHSIGGAHLPRSTGAAQRCAVPRVLVPGALHGRTGPLWLRRVGSAIDRDRLVTYRHEASGEDEFGSGFSQQLQVLHFHVLRSIAFTRLLYHSGGFFGANYFPNAP